jgi:hypothetical protein
LPTSGRELQIFISYRRDDSAFEATVIYETLQKSFGKRCAFMDVDGIPIGADFSSHIAAAIRRSEVCLAVISRDWLDAADSDGQRRLDNQDDFVRRELEAAHDAGVQVVPVLIGKTALPDIDQLPLSLRFLPSLQAIVVRPGGDLQKDLAHLCARIREIESLRSNRPLHHHEGGGLLGRLSTSIWKCTWHPLLDGLLVTPFLIIATWEKVLSVAEGVPTGVFTTVGLFALGLLVALTSVVLAAMHELVLCGVTCAWRKLALWNNWVFCLVAAICAALCLVAISFTRYEVQRAYMLTYACVWLVLLLVQHLIDFAQGRVSRLAMSAGQAVAWKLLSASAGAIVLLAVWLTYTFRSSPTIHFDTYVDFGLNLTVLGFVGSMIGSAYFTAAQIVRGTLQFSSWQTVATRE